MSARRQIEALLQEYLNRIEIIDFQRLRWEGTARYTFTIDFGDILVYGCKVFDWHADKPLYVSMPSRRDPEVWRVIHGKACGTPS